MRKAGICFVKAPVTCDPDPCVNGRTCTEDDSGEKSCTCPAGFSGDQCESKYAARNNVEIICIVSAYFNLYTMRKE